MKKAFKVLLWILSIPAAIVALILICGQIAWWVSNMGDKAPPKQAAKVSKPEAPSMSIERKFVSIDKGYVFEEGDQDVVRCKYLSRTLADRFNTTNNDICDKTVAARDLMKNKYGVYEKLMNILEDMNKIIPTVSNPDYKKYVVSYIFLRKDGYSRSAAIARAENHILEMGYSPEK